MKMKRNPLGHIRFIYRRSSPLTKCVVLAAIVLSTLALIALRIGIQAQQGQQQKLQEQAAQLEYENYQLAKQIAELGTVESVKRIATLELGLVDPDSQFFTPSDSENAD